MFNWFKTKKNEPRRRTPADVEEGETIQVEWNRFNGPDKIGHVICVSNDFKTRKLLIKAQNTQNKWENYIWDYSCDQLKNFHLLNGTNETPAEVALRELKSQIEELW